MKKNQITINDIASMVNECLQSIFIQLNEGQRYANNGISQNGTCQSDSPVSQFSHRPATPAQFITWLRENPLL